MNRDVFLSLLALDSYNRGYGFNVELRPSGQIGTAEIGDDAETILDPGVAEAAGFYAIAYSWQGQTIISYRGTNFEFASAAEFINSPLYNDVFGGWTLGGGFSSTSQGSLATPFYMFAFHPRRTEPRSLPAPKSRHSREENRPSPLAPRSVCVLTAGSERASAPPCPSRQPCRNLASRCQRLHPWLLEGRGGHGGGGYAAADDERTAGGQQAGLSRSFRPRPAGTVRFHPPR